MSLAYVSEMGFRKILLQNTKDNAYSNIGVRQGENIVSLLFVLLYIYIFSIFYKNKLTSGNHNWRIS